LVNKWNLGYPLQSFVLGSGKQHFPEFWVWICFLVICLMSLRSNIEDEWKGALEHCSQILVWLLDLSSLSNMTAQPVPGHSEFGSRASKMDCSSLIFSKFCLAIILGTNML
jgi:hypothetical protein